MSTDPFQAARFHANRIKKLTCLVIAAPVALGAELLRIKAEINPKIGRPSKTGNDLPISGEITEATPWRDLVAEKTGLSYEACRRAMLAAERVIHRLETSKQAHHKSAAKLLKAPPAEWTDDDYAGLSETVGAVYDADTFNQLLIECGVIRDKTKDLAGGNKPGLLGKSGKSLSARDEAAHYWRNYYRALASDRADEATFRKRLRYLPVTSDNPAEETSLADLAAELDAHRAIVKDEIARRA